MAFLSTETLKNILDANFISDFEPNNIKHCAYELNLGDEVFITDSTRTKRKIKSHEQIEIPPGQFALLITKEVINIPTKYIGFISIKYSYKIKGLINISGFHVDPGFNGKLKFSVYNAGSRSIILDCGKPLFLLWLSTLDVETQNAYDGEHKNQLSINSKDVSEIQGEVTSPANLKKEIDSLKRKFKTLKGILYLIVASLITLLLSQQNFNCNNNNLNNKTTMSKQKRVQEINDSLKN